MGILNVTPDSFSDGGRFTETEAALAHACAMLQQGADIIDVGGESTRPGSQSVPAEEQLHRILPVLSGLRERIGEHVAISIDTTSAEVGEQALNAGGSWLNDVSGGDADPRMLSLAADRAVPIVLMHHQGTPETMQRSPQYQDVVREVRDYLAARVDAALAAGVVEANILLDPGIGFGKLAEHNLALLARLDELVSLGFPLLLGTSRKRFMGSICKVSVPSELMPATCATTALGVMAGVSVFRVHDVAANRQAADIAWAMRNAA